jgi:hypothetical protein
MEIIVVGFGVLILVGFVGFWGLYAGLGMWNEFVEPALARRRKQKEALEIWLEDNPGYERKRWWT